MIFQDSSIVVEERCIAAGHYVEIVCGPSMLVVVNNRRHQGGENLQIGQPILQTSRANRAIACVDSPAN